LVLSPGTAPNGVRSTVKRWTVWGSAYGGSNNANGNAAVGSDNVTATAFGFAAGWTITLRPRWSSASHSPVLAPIGCLADALGSGRGDAFQAGVYGINWFGPAYLAKIQYLQPS
jgi:hypothetical protein